MVLERRSSGQQVADELRRRIFAGDIAAGTRLLQTELATELGVSRIPVREALVILESEGRIRLELHKGAVVLPMGEDSVRDNVEVYGRVYGYIARCATQRATPAFLETMADLESRLLASPGDRETRLLNQRYLDAISEVGAGPRMVPLLRALGALHPDNFDDVVPAVIEGLRKGILAMVRAIRAGDADLVETESLRVARAANGALVIEEFQRRGMLGSLES